MKITLLISVFMSLNVYALSSAPVNVQENLDLDTLQSSSLLKGTYKDKLTASHIVSLYNMSIHDYLNKSQIALTKKEISKNTLFKVYEPWIINLEKLSAVKDVSDVAKLCRNTIFKHKNDILFLQKNLERICANLFVEKTMKNLNEISFFEKTNYDFFKTYISLIYYRVDNRSLISFLEKTSFNDKIHKATSNIFIDFFIKKNRVPTSQILTKLEFTPLFNEFIQRRGLSDASSKQVFYEELDHYADKIMSLADNEVSEEIILKKIKEINNFFSLSKDKLPLKRAYNKIHYLGKSLARRKFYDSSRGLFSQVLSSKIKDQKEEAQFDIIWSFLSQKNFKQAATFIENEKLVENFSKIEEPKLMFWVAHVLSRSEEKKSLKLHSELVQKYPLSYYAILSTRHIKETESSFPTLHEIIPENTSLQSSLTPQEWTPQVQNSFKRLKLWTKLGNYRFQELEKSIISQKMSPALQVLTAKVLKDERDYLASFKVIYKGIYSNELALTKDVLKILYPKPFWESVVSNKNNIDPVLAISLIRQESGFNPEARSRVGATGLMQLMPTTAKRFYRSATVKRLEDPFLNIKIGTKYFSNLLKRYDASVVHSLAAYNAGEGRVDRWQNEYFNGDTALHNIEEIPFLETRKYVKLIFRNVFFYKFLEEPAKVASSENLNLLFAEYLGYKN